MSLCALLASCSQEDSGASGAPGAAGQEAAQTPGSATPPAAAPEAPRNLLVFLVDTLRADRLGCYGNPAQPSPTIDAFAEQGILFERAYAPSPYTATSHASLFTSLAPPVHGVWNKLELEDGKTEMPALAESAVTLAEVYREAGYQTAAVADGGFLSVGRGLHQGFDLFDSETRYARNRMDRALRWLKEERDPERPFFLFLHTYEVHTPYIPAEDSVERMAPGYEGPIREAVRKAREKFDGGKRAGSLHKAHRLYFRDLFAGELTAEQIEFVRAVYDAEIHVVDQEFARLLAYLEESGLAEDTAVVLTSDHGEELWEHDRFGHNRVWEEQLHIPLMVRLPGGPAGVRRSDSIDLIDLMPTLLGLMELNVPAQATGVQVDLRRAPEAPVAREHMAMANQPKELAAFRRGGDKVILGLDQTSIFDLAADPDEREDLAGTPAGRALLAEARAFVQRYMEESLDRRQRFGLGPVLKTTQSMAAEQLEQLQELGYLDGDEED